NEIKRAHSSVDVVALSTRTEWISDISVVTPRCFGSIGHRRRNHARRFPTFAAEAGCCGLFGRFLSAVLVHWSIKSYASSDDWHNCKCISIPHPSKLRTKILTNSPKHVSMVVKLFDNNQWLMTGKMQLILPGLA
ncbi:MAG: hypothetical protein WAM62_03920, partial [Pseudolabrys sp.]